MNTRITSIAALLTVTVGAGLAQATVVAIQRSGTTIYTSTRVSATFKDAVAAGTLSLYTDGSTGQSMVADTWLNPLDSTTRYWNEGSSLTNTVSGSYALIKFDLAALPGFVGSTVNLAQMQMYFYSTSGLPPFHRYVSTHDWAEGNKAGDFPGTDPAAAGATMTSPMGLNSDATGAPSWGIAGDQVFSLDNDTTVAIPSGGGASYDYPGPGWNGQTYSNDGNIAYSITTAAQGWANGMYPNYGYAIDCKTWRFTFSEVGGNFQPVLFIDYTPVPEPATLALVLLGGIGLARRRQHRSPVP